MFDVIGSSLFALLANLFAATPDKTIEPLELGAWQDTAIFELPKTEVDPVLEQIVQDYLQKLQRQGLNSDRQGIWLQSDWSELSSHQGKKPLSAASLTKIATTLASLGKWGADHQFATKVFYTGEIREGILDGDLIVLGDGDPFFVWEEAIALGNALNKLGLRQVTGNLLVDNRFYMNYEADSFKSGQLLRQALDPKLWSSEVKQQFQKLPITTARPQVVISGEAKLLKFAPSEPQLLLTHKSLTLSDILKQMNIYSNNKMAQMLADEFGGAAAVAKYAVKVTSLEPSEVQLINGSGLGMENRVSPRAASQMLIAIDSLLQPHNLDVMDLFPVAGRDNVGTVEDRSIPNGTAVKTGTLNQVSALAGVIQIDQERRVWFSLINYGWQISYFRKQQDLFLQSLAEHWQLDPQDFIVTEGSEIYLGDPERNILAN
ncbi:MAG: D-alanyl-D-alanine carboxypeptidase [Cyanobacteria bacterium P01_F01_bin.143]